MAEAEEEALAEAEVGAEVEAGVFPLEAEVAAGVSLEAEAVAVVDFKDSGISMKKQLSNWHYTLFRSRCYKIGITVYFKPTVIEQSKQRKPWLAPLSWEVSM